MVLVSAVTYKGEVPEQDVHENSQDQGPPASAPPPLTDMDNLQGYENTQFLNGKGELLVYENGPNTNFVTF